MPSDGQFDSSEEVSSAGVSARVIVIRQTRRPVSSTIHSPVEVRGAMLMPGDCEPAVCGCR